MKKVNWSRLKSYLMFRPSVPEGSIEDVAITKEVIPAGREIEVVSMRNAIFMGWQPARCTFEQDYVSKKLTYEGGTWFQDVPCEIWQMDDALRGCEGKTLVGGLGLGVFSHLASYSGGRIGRTVTVEKDARIIELVARHITTRNTTECADLFEFIQGVHPGHFDSAFFDIWQPTGETVWFQYVVPLRRACRNKIPQKNVFAWQEEEMVGQVRQVLLTAIDTEESVFDNKYSFHYRVFREAAVKAGLRGKAKLSPCTAASMHESFQKKMEIEQENSQDKKVLAFVKLYLGAVGTDKWERAFGETWDRLYAGKERA
jgi:hypothetical protein